MCDACNYNELYILRTEVVCQVNYLVYYSCFDHAAFNMTSQTNNLQSTHMLECLHCSLRHSQCKASASSCCEYEKRKRSFPYTTGRKIVLDYVEPTYQHTCSFVSIQLHCGDLQTVKINRSELWNTECVSAEGSVIEANLLLNT